MRQFMIKHSTYNVYILKIIDHHVLVISWCNCKLYDLFILERKLNIDESDVFRLQREYATLQEELNNSEDAIEEENLKVKKILIRLFLFRVTPVNTSSVFHKISAIGKRM